jgi:probable phosphoglycerate mutase
MPLTLHLLRHAQTAASRDNYHCGRGTDLPLTADGLGMAESCARAFSGRGWTAIFASPQLRARQTVAPIAAAAGLAVSVDEGLAEIDYGGWEGLSATEAEARDPERRRLWLDDPALHAPPGGETAVAVSRRALGALERIQGAHPEGEVLVVTHKATIRVLLSALLGLDLARYRDRLACPVCSLSTLELAPRGPILHVHGDRSHLDPAQRALPGT